MDSIDSIEINNDLVNQLDFCNFKVHRDTCKLNSSRVMSFSLFCANESNMLDWKDRYVFTQFRNFNHFLTLKNWEDVAIIHFIDKRIIDYKISYSQTILDFFNNIYTKYPNRYCIIIYDNCGEENSLIRQSKYFGTVVRFVPLIMKGLNSVYFRDAHSTIPCKTNSNKDYDNEWRMAWKNSDKKMWMYHSIYYKPKHVGYKSAAYAAAWAARRSLNEDRIWPIDLWNKTFGNVKDILDDSYGIDERIFLDVIKDYNYKGNSFFEDTFLVGAVHFIYLFLNPTNMLNFDTPFKTISQLKSIMNDTNDNIIKEKINDVIKYLNTKVLASDFFGYSYETFFSSITCMLYFITEFISLKYNKETNSSNDLLSSVSNITAKSPIMTLNDVWEFIEKIQKDLIQKFKLIDKTDPDISDFFNFINEKQFELIPPRYHIWEFLFTNLDIQDFSSILNAELAKKQEIGISKNNFVNEKCNFGKNLFIGNQFENNYILLSNKTLIDNLPQNHPFNQFNEPRSND